MTYGMKRGAPYFENRKVTVHDLFVGNFVNDYQDQFLAEMAEWYAVGLLKYREDIRPGLESAPAALAAMLDGSNFGKMIVQVAAE